MGNMAHVRDIPRGWRRWSDKDIYFWIAMHATAGDQETEWVIDAMLEELDARDSIRADIPDSDSLQDHGLSLGSYTS